MDDDIILNIAENYSTSSKKKASPKSGGRWTDRLKAKRTAKRKHPHDTSAASTSEAALDPSPRPTKRTKHERSKDDVRTPGTFSVPTNPAPQASGQFISSLFTFNPSVSNPKHAVRAPGAPSNAPLRDLSTFSGLGLNPLIAAHLETKLDIKKPTAIQRSSIPAIISEQPDSTQRDVFIQSQTGSGKTLSYLLPIIHDLLPLSSLSYIDRSIGTLAIIIAPTRELAKQISDVLETLLTMRLRPQDENPDGETVEHSERLTRWLVSGLLIGGATRTHEKARLRKGLPFLVATPGRLLDHLQNTASFNVGKCRWLVLDEADRLMDLGFEQTIDGILKGLEGRRKLALTAVEEGKSHEVGGWDWSRSRRTVLCSATIRDDVQKLAGVALRNPIMVKEATSASSSDPALSGSKSGQDDPFMLPAQLSQKYIVVPLKLRLVTLIALLRSILSQATRSTTTSSKVIVFLSCTDSVDFHWHLMGDRVPTSESASDSEDAASEEEEEDAAEASEPKAAPKTKSAKDVGLKSQFLPQATLFRLHGSLPLRVRQETMRQFVKEQDKSSLSILLCTSVASRGLDLPFVRAVIQYDLPTEGGATEYVHRVGRTARVGKSGEAWSFVSPSESEWPAWLSTKLRDARPSDSAQTEKPSVQLDQVGYENVLKSGFGGTGTEFEARATDIQLAFERWVLKSQQSANMARKAFLSHTRAYATHPSDEKHIFHVKKLHLGHLAKAFALRDAPAAVSATKSKSKPSKHAHTTTTSSKREKANGKVAKKPVQSEKWMHGEDPMDAEHRMNKVVRAQGRMSKKGGISIATDASEFQIAGVGDLAKLVGNFP
ncbi:DEAD-domain-containing protein [Sistotremastrum suecicum HHB10207 ss-3]|uniref:ATP-dependent RNA helicase n=1 Tax=Sistotremastrum suecicum HHB10207 ss-3 TaxID=1314776 RepID=A0A166H7B3_9AGAM|nr:DEAD-domain-containing protein [Sistotremastrum suecicum HHB10207 ss-3]